MTDPRRAYHRGGSGASADGPPSPKIALRECLASLALPPGLLSSVMQSYTHCDSRLMLIDNSSAMKVRDSHVGRVVNKRGTGGAVLESVDNVTRWEELQECVAFHCGMASKCWIPTKFWLINDDRTAGGHKFSLCWGAREDVPDEMATIRKVMKHASLDKRRCPLTDRVHSLAKGIAKEERNIRARDKHVTLVICTQGVPTDSHGDKGAGVRRELQHELAKLSNLPVKVIVRLCTDDEGVRDMFNTMDSKFNSIDVLDDYWGEAIEVFLHNPWLTYGIGLHRLREAGLAPGVVDNIDDQTLDLDEIHELCTLLFVGEDGCIRIPHPKDSWANFVRALKVLVEKEELQWNPVKKKSMPWINFDKLESIHGRRHRGHRHRREKQHNDRARRQERSKHSNHEREKQARANEPRRRSSQQSEDPPEERGHSSRGHQRDDEPRRSSSNERDEPAAGKDLTLTEVLERWSHKTTIHGKYDNSLQHLLVHVPDTFPPTNPTVEEHEYFAKWKTFDEEAFADVDGDELKELLKRAVRKAKFFLHPDKLPKDLSDDQALLFRTLWDVIAEREEATLG